MSEIEEVQEQMKADMEAMKEQMATMIEVMMSMKKIMEVNAAVVATTSAIAKVNLTPSSSLGYGRSGRQRVGKYGRPPFCASLEQACLPAIWLAS